MLKILVVYTTKTGTTQHAAEIIADTFRKRTFEVDVKTIEEAGSLSPYDCIVVGAPINGMQWHPQAVEFVTQHQSELKQKTVAYYFMSYMIGNGREFWNRKIQSSLNGVSGLVKPVHMGMFSGKVGSDFPAVARWIFGIKKGTPSDLTSDEQVRAWAEACVEQFAKKSL